jgi:hypothetical protein
MSTAILSASNHPASLMKSSTSISGASSVSSLNCYPYSTVKDYHNTTTLVVRDHPDVSSSSIASSRDAHASAPQPALPIVPLCQQITQYTRPYKQQCPAPTKYAPRAVQPQLIATISVGFDKGDYLIREEKGHNVYFDFLEEAYNFIVQKGYSRMPKYEEDDYMELIKRAQKSVPGGCRFNPGKLLMVFKKKLVPVVAEYCEEKSMGFNSSGSNKKRSNSKSRHLSNSLTTLPTDDESFSSNESYPHERSKSSTYEQSSCSTSYVDSWE